MLYHILTEDINRPAIERIVGESFDAYTFIHAEGHWRGKAEHSLVIELDTDRSNDVAIVARRIKEYNKQEAVLVQRLNVESELI